MLAVIIYLFVWFIVAALSLLLYFTGFLNEITQILLGFICAALFFAGIVMVLPLWVNDHYSPKNPAGN